MEIIKQRIEAEYRKHKSIDWQSILAAKLEADYINKQKLIVIWNDFKSLNMLISPSSIKRFEEELGIRK